MQNRLNKALRVGIYLFAAMQWVSGVGYAMFPLTQSGFGGALSDVMHAAVTVLVVLLSVASLGMIAWGGCRGRQYPSLARWALVALVMMMAGSMGVGMLPADCFGLAERLSLLAAVGFNAVLGVCLFTGFRGYRGGERASHA